MNLTEELEDFTGQLIKLQTALERRIIPSLNHNRTAQAFLQEATLELANARSSVLHAGMAVGMAQDV